MRKRPTRFTEPRVRRRVSEVCALIHVTGVPAPARRIRFSRSWRLLLGGLAPTRRAATTFTTPLRSDTTRLDPLSRSKASVTAKKLRPVNRLVYTGEVPPPPRLVGDQAEATGPEGRVSEKLFRTICPNRGPKRDFNGISFFRGGAGASPSSKRHGGALHPPKCGRLADHHASRALVSMMVGCPCGPPCREQQAPPPKLHWKLTGCHSLGLQSLGGGPPAASEQN